MKGLTKGASREEAIAKAAAKWASRRAEEARAYRRHSRMLAAAALAAAEGRPWAQAAAEESEGLTSTLLVRDLANPSSPRTSATLSDRGDGWAASSWASVPDGADPDQAGRALGEASARAEGKASAALSDAEWLLGSVRALAELSRAAAGMRESMPRSLRGMDLEWPEDWLEEEG